VFILTTWILVATPLYATHAVVVAVVVIVVVVVIAVVVFRCCSRRQSGDTNIGYMAGAHTRIGNNGSTMLLR
jgi:hypothetical protein